MRLSLDIRIYGVYSAITLLDSLKRANPSRGGGAKPWASWHNSMWEVARWPGYQETGTRLFVLPA
jgi:hypothetical protein